MKYELNEIVITQWDGTPVCMPVLYEDKNEALKSFESYCENIKAKRGLWDGSEEVELRIRKVY